jgi:hypothetical protein
VAAVRQKTKPEEPIAPTAASESFPKYAIVAIAPDTGNANMKVCAQVRVVEVTGSRVVSQQNGSVQTFIVPSYVYESSTSVTCSQRPGSTAFQVVTSDAEGESGRYWLTGEAAFGANGDDAVFVGQNASNKVNYALPTLLGNVISVVPNDVTDILVFCGVGAHKKAIGQNIGPKIKGRHVIRRLASHGSLESFVEQCSIEVHPMLIPESLGGVLTGFQDHKELLGDRRYLAFDLGGGTWQVLLGKQGELLGDPFEGREILRGQSGNRLIENFARSSELESVVGSGGSMGAESFSGVREALYNYDFNNQRVIYAGKDVTRLWKEYVESSVHRLKDAVTPYMDRFGAIDAPIIGFGGTFLFPHFREAASMVFSYGIGDDATIQSRLLVSSNPLFANAISNLDTTAEEFATDIEVATQEFEASLRKVLGK